MTPEGKVKAKIRELLKQYGSYSHSPVQNGMGRPSLDFVCCMHGQYFAVEAKAPGNTLTPRQELTKKEIEDAGGKVFVVGERDLRNTYGSEYDYSGLEALEKWLRDIRDCSAFVL